MTLTQANSEGVFRVHYKKIDAIEIRDGVGDAEPGSLRLYRRRGIWGLLRRQDVFHPGPEWQRVELTKDGRCTVVLTPSAERVKALDVPSTGKREPS